MNTAIIVYILGYVLQIEAALMVLPCLVALYYREGSGIWFVIVGVITAILGFLMSRKKPADGVFYLKEGCVTTALAWIIMSIMGCLPFCLSGSIPSFTDALFEMISGFTTTGSSILTDVEALPWCMLFWRSFSHWVGGMGVLVFLLAIVPLSGGSNMNLMKAESPGPSVGKLVPKVRATARILYIIYFALTCIEFILLLLGKMPFMDAMLITFGTAGTGGFGVKNTSIGGYSGYVQWIVGIFMMLFGVNFNAYFFITLRKFKDAWNMEEIKGYLAMILAAVILIVINVYDGSMTFLTTLRHVFFTVSSLVTSTGFATVDFDLWPNFAKTVLIIVMFIGACAGSTGGGLKVSRVIIMFKSMKRELNAFLHPKSVRSIKMDGKTVDESMVASVNVYFAIFMVVFATSIFLVSLEGKDLITNFTAVLTTLNNMGPGLALVGPTQNFAHMSVLSKYVLMFDMLAGRLELFPMLILFHPILWKETIEKKRHAKKTAK